MEAAVRIQEVDLSSRVASFAGVFGAIVVQAKRGDSSRPTLVSNNRQYLDRYTPKGKIEIGDDLAHYSALSYLTRSDKLWVQRVINGALYGGAAIKTLDATTPNNSLQIGFADPDGYVFDSQVDVIGRPEITRVTFPANTIIPAVNGVYSVAAVADQFKSLLDTFFIIPENGTDSVAFWFNINGEGSEPAHGATRSIEVVIDENDTNVTVANKIAAMADADSSFSAVGASGVVSITLAYAGVDSQTASNGDSGMNVTQEVTGVDLNYSLNEKGFIIHDHTGSVGVWFNINGIGSVPSFASACDRVVEISSLVSAATFVEVAQAVHAEFLTDPAFSVVLLNNEITFTDGQDGIRTSAVSHGTGIVVEVVQGGQDEADEEDEALMIYASSEGAFAKDIGIRITTHLDDADLVPEEGSFLLEIYRKGLEGTPVETFFCSRILGKMDGFGRNMYIEDVLKASAFVRGLNNDLIDENIYPKSQNSILWLGGGDDGLTPTASNMITAANKFSNADEIPVTILMDGGYATPAYGAALDTIAKTRMDCIAILSTPYSAEVHSDYLNEISNYRKNDLNLNSSYSALYTPHVLIQDTFNDREIYIAPDGFVAGSISFNANSREIWYPPAGYRRGIIDVRGVSRVLESGDRSHLYNIGVNPIKSTSGRGIVVWGQKTLLSKPSLLNRLNVRLLLIVISPAMKEFLEDYLFEFNDRITRGEVEQKISDYLRDIQGRRGLVRFQVICDETNNTPQVIDNNQMICDVLITPSGSIEDIPLRIVIVNNSTSFADASQAV